MPLRGCCLLLLVLGGLFLLLDTVELPVPYEMLLALVAFLLVAACVQPKGEGEE